MKINRHHARFTVGEYSRAAITRVDLDDTQLAAEIQENLIPSLAGDARFRPGTEYLDTTRDNEQARLIPFVRDTDDFALIEMTAGKLRIIIDDAFITRPTVTSTLVNPNFDLATGWTTATTGNEITQGASYANLQSGTYNNQLVMGAFAQGSTASAVQAVTIPAEELGTVHALRIDVFRGPVLFRIGSTSGGQEVVSEQILQRGTHSLAFTPTAAIASTYYIWFGTRFETEGVVNSCQFESGGIMNLDAPWTAAELREVSFDQAADVIYFAHESWIPHQLTRRGTTSWSMTEFQQDGGPTELVSDGTRISISATRNQAVVTATEDYFSSAMVGTVIRAFHDRLNASYSIAGPGEFTEPWVVRGIKGKKNNDRLFKYRIFGGEAYGTPGTPPFDGVITMQRSISGEDGDYLDHPRDDGTLTSFDKGSGLVTVNGKDEDANLVAWHRLGFKTDADYTSGFAEINVQYQGMGGFGWGRIIDYYSPRQVLIEIIDKFHSTGEANLWNIGTWNTSVPWPSCVALSDNRLWFGGRSQVWASALNDYANFDDIDTSALRTLTRTLGSSGSSSSARWFLPLQRLIVGTEGSQVSIRAGAFDQGVTADNVTLKDAATIGANYVSPIKLDSRGVFVHGSGSDMYVMKPGQNDYVAERMTVHNDEILDLGVVELAAQRQPETMVWAVRSDGQVPVCMYEFEGDVDTKTWWRFITAGDVESVAVLPGAVEDRIYMVVNRTPDPDDESITGAEELAPSGVDVFSADLTDQSVLVVDSGTPANDLNTDERFDEWGNIVGLETIVSQNTSDLKLTLQSSGYLGYQPHNLAPSSYDLTVSEFRSFSGGTVGTAPNTTYPAPDGVGVMHKIIPAVGDSTSGIEFDLNIPGAGSGSARKVVEISFYTKYESGEGDAMTDWDVDIIDASDSSFVAFCTYFMDQLSGAPADDLIYINYDVEGNPIYGSYLDDRVLNYTGEPAPSSTAFDQPAIAYLEGSTVYLRLRYRFYLDAPEAWVRIYPSGVTSDGVRGGYLWGLQVNLLPTAEQLAGGYSQLVQHADNAPRILLPYEWDSAGTLEGIRVEPAGENKLVSGTDFTYADFTASSLTVNYTGDDASPDGLSQGTQLLEAAGTSVHKLSHPIIGVDGQYVASTYVYPGELTYLALRLYGVNGESFLANFNVDAGAIDLESVSGVTNADAGFEVLPFGCYRIWVTGTISVEQPGVMRSSNSTTAAFVSLSEPTLTSSGSSTTTWSRAGDVVGAFSSSGSASTSLVGDTFEEGANLLVNGGFETGSISPWTGTYSVSSGGGGPYEGTYYATDYDFSTALSQRIDLVDRGVSADQLDYGNVELEITGYVRGDFSGTETYATYIRWYDSVGSAIGNTLQNVLNITPAVANTWENFNTFSLASPLAAPPGAREFLVSFQGVTKPGSFFTFDFDSVVIRETIKTLSTGVFANPSFESFIQNETTTSGSGSAADFIPGWSIEQGSWQHFQGTVTILNPVAPQDGTYWIQGRTGSVNELRQDCLILDRFDGLITAAEIDSGQVTLDFSIYRNNTAGSDTSRVLVEARDSGGTVISTLYDTGTSELTPNEVWTQSSITDVQLPANTRIISCRLFANLVAGSFANVGFDNIESTLTVTPIPALTAAGASTAGFVANQITPFTIEGTATATMSGGGTYPTAMSSAGVAAASWDGFKDYRILDGGTATVTWSPIVSAASAGVAAASFGLPATSGDVTMAGSATATFVGKAQETTATFSLILSDVTNQTVTSENEIAFPAESTRGVVVWGAQLEYNRTRPSSFISRTSTEARAADAYTIDNASIPLSDTAVSMFAEIKRSHAEAGTILGITAGDDALSLELDSSAQSLHRVRDDGGDVAYIVDGVAVENTLTRLASSAQVDDAKFVVDGGSALTDTSMTMPAVSGGTTFIGSGYDGIISRIMLLPQASSEEALQGYGLVQEPPTYRYIEKLALKSEAIGGSTNKMADSGAFFAGPASTVTCAWLVERSDVVAWATNASGLAVPLAGLTSDVDGNIDLGGTYTNIWVGLGYTARYRSGKLAFQNRGGTALLQRKRVAELGVLLENTHRDAIRFGEDFDRMRYMNLVKAGAIQAAGTIYSTYDDKSFSFPGSWNTDARLCLEVQAPYPATLLGLVIGLEWHERGLG